LPNPTAAAARPIDQAPRFGQRGCRLSALHQTGLPAQEQKALLAKLDKPIARIIPQSDQNSYRYLMTALGACDLQFFSAVVWQTGHYLQISADWWQMSAAWPGKWNVLRRSRPITARRARNKSDKFAPPPPTAGGPQDSITLT
jgi:hypothetical protein